MKTINDNADKTYGYRMLSQIQPVEGGIEIREINASHTEVLSYEQLRRKYNELVEDLWFYLESSHELYQELGDLWYSLDKISDELYD